MKTKLSNYDRVKFENQINGLRLTGEQWEFIVRPHAVHEVIGQEKRVSLLAVVGRLKIQEG